ncbi:SDR family oxidoreductase [Streptomyces sp. NPDC006134]|uniref:SDR family oxidoreductase n=1 Tax=Streptomyces sp. NPDC006134 TaxID=3154467 RepID=UPI0033CC14A5
MRRRRLRARLLRRSQGPACSAGKGGVVRPAKALAVARAAEGIRVNAVAPGWIRTGPAGNVRADGEADRHILTCTPMCRWGGPGGVAGAVAFLAGAGTVFVAGTVLAVDGGTSRCERGRALLRHPRPRGRTRADRPPL